MTREDLDWQIDDEEGDLPREPDNAPERTARPAAPAARHLPRWTGWAALVLLLASLGGGWAAWRVRLQLDDQRAAVLRVAQLEDRLVRAGDVEVFLSLQDPNNVSWRDWQREQATSARLLPDFADGHERTGLRWGSSALNFYLDAGEPSYGDVQLDGEAAALRVTRRYAQVGVPGLLTSTLALQATQYYHFVAGGWIRVAPPADVWARVISDPRGPVTILYPAQDAPALEPILPRLSALAARACEDLGCPDNAPVTLDLSANPAELRPMRLTQSPGGYWVYAPAPGLAGAPANEAGAEALYRLYGRSLAGLIAARALPEAAQGSGGWLGWELAHLGLEARVDPTAMRDAARLALYTGQDPLALGDQPTGGLWLSLDFLRESGDEHPLAGYARWAVGRAGVDNYLRARTDARLFDWWDYIEGSAALEPRYPGSAQLALICSGQAYLWKASSGALRPLGFSADQIGWSQDGTHVVGLYARTSYSVLDVQRGTLYTDTGRVLAISPDAGKVILQGEGVRYTFDIAAHQLSYLTRGSGWAQWTPDGRHIAYALDDRVFVRNAADGGWELAGAAPYAFSTHNRYLTLVAPDANTRSTRLSFFDVDAARTTAVLTTGILSALAWAPGEPARLAIGVNEYGDAGTFVSATLEIVEVGDGGARVLRAWPQDRMPAYPQWLSGGQSLAWINMGGSDRDSEMVTASLIDGSTRARALGRLSGDNFSWGVSPDGAWTVIAASANTRVWDRDFSTGRTLPASCYAPAWQP